MNIKAELEALNKLKDVYHAKKKKVEAMCERAETLAVYMLQVQNEIQGLIKAMNESTDGDKTDSLVANIQLLAIDADAYKLESDIMRPKFLVLCNELDTLEQEINNRLVYLGLNAIKGAR